MPKKAEKPAKPKAAKPSQEIVKATDLALSNITKKYGSGTAYMMGERKADQIPVLPTGILGLDIATGIGGLPRGRIVETYGPESGGKCLPKETYIATECGWMTIEEIFKDCGLVASKRSHTTKQQRTLVNRHGRLEDTTHFTHNHTRHLIEIETRTGQVIRATFNHPHLTMNERGQWVWKRSGEIRPGDILVTQRRVPCGSGTIPLDEAYGAGLLIADGALCRRRIMLTNDDPCVLSFAREKLPAILGTKIKEYPTKGHSANLHFSGLNALTKFYENTGLSPCKAAGKHIPLFYRGMGEPCLRELVRGYMDCECWIDGEKPAIEVCSASQELLRQVKLILLQFGIISCIAPKRVKAYPNTPYWRLTISGLEVRKYVERVGFRSQLRKDQASKLPMRKQVQTNLDSIPTCGLLLSDLLGASESHREHWHEANDYIGEKPKARLTYERLRRILSLEWNPSNALDRLREIQEADYFYDEVSVVRDGGQAPTFDFAMSETHSFVANGVVTHNTTLAIHAIRECQRRGQQAAYIDAEQAMSPYYVRSLGADPDRLIFCQPDYGEQALEVVRELVRSETCALIVIDSVAALVPKAELDGESGDSFMGLMARMMSQAMRQMAGEVNKTETCVLFINQVREKIGVVFGNPEVTPGGRGLKFYASLRIEVRRTASLKDGEALVGNRVKVKIAKNKCASPGREAEFDLIFGKGAHRGTELIDWSEKYGLIEKSGSWYSYHGERLGQGRQAAGDALLEPGLEEIGRKLTEEIYSRAGIPRS